MQPLEEHPVLLKGLKTAQIIVFALLAGVVTFLVILLAMHSTKGPMGPASESAIPITWLLIGTGVADAILVLVLREVVLSSARKRIAEGTWQPPGARRGGAHPYAEAGDAGRLFVTWLTATIITAAGMEAGALLSLVAYLIEGKEIALVAAGAFGLLLALLLPTRGRLDPWLDSELLKLRAPKGEVRER